MGCYYTLCHNTYAFSLLFYKVYMKRGNAGSWNSRLEKEQILETYSAQLQSPKTSREQVSEYIKNIGRKKYQRGATHRPQGWGARPTPLGVPPASWASWWPSDAHLWLYGVFRREKNCKQAHGTKLHCHEAEL